MAKKKSKASKSSLVRKPLPVASEAKIKSMNMKFRAVDSAKTFRAEKRQMKAASRRYFLIHAWGGVELEIISRGFKTRERVLEEARKKTKEDCYQQESDNFFYLQTEDGRKPFIGCFANSEMEDQEEAADHADLVRHDALGLNDGPTRPEKACGAWDDDED